jgi:gliding motility-associated-like protein
LGTITQEILAGNTIESGDLPGPSAVPGQYTSEESFSTWIGSPVNGVWTLSILDDQYQDDGFLTAWSITVNPLLYPDAVTFTPSYGAGPDSTYWSGPSIVNSDPGADVVTVAPTTLGQVSYTYTAINDFGCTFDTTLTITVTPGVAGPITVTGDNEICQGTVTQLSAPAGFSSYHWSNGYQGQNISTGPGTYTVTVFSGDCSLESEPLTVTGIPSPAPVINGPVGFTCGSGQATLSTTLPYGTYHWSNDAVTPTIAVGTGSYTVTVTQDGCTGVSTPFSVTVGSDPHAAFITSPTSPQNIGTTVDLDASGSQGNGSAITTYEWMIGNTGNSTGVTTNHTFSTPGEFGIMLVITNADGCQDSVMYNFVIIPEAIIIPNVFTPNGDKNNERFEIENGQYLANELSVYDRWGKQIFNAKNYRNTWSAADVPDGTYYYVFRTVHDSKEYTGHVTILR